MDGNTKSSISIIDLVTAVKELEAFLGKTSMQSRYIEPWECKSYL